MCKKGEHEKLCEGISLCRREHTVTVWLSRFRRMLGMRYADMSDVELLTPVFYALRDWIDDGTVQTVRVHVSHGYLAFPVGEGVDDAK